MTPPTTAAELPKAASARPPQLKCEECNHSFTFHGSGQTRCRAGGCRCPHWVQPPPPLSVADVASKLGKSQTWVKEHAEELGGEKVAGHRIGKNISGEVWRFHSTVALSGGAK